MGWLKNAVRKWLSEDVNNNMPDISQPRGNLKGIPTPRITTGLDRNDGLHFTLYSASGGNIVEFRRYDVKTDSHDISLHIIRSDEDFTEALANIITFVKLRA